MNQAILFNDDHYFDSDYGCWCFSGQLAGEKILIVLAQETEQQITINTEVTLDWESLVEDWLEDNEPDQGVITLT
ncbi:hypothetical protein tinsulaeT_18660 [Thalassotalea insulae]|uniref:Uncharacterized protein n=1 Tax=Thalassotalea insulae TaxID=2056778 RepID=A0ABQ6GV52_9GAMM|nr:hypothetical protein [Thalassotalea insulae]GLX78526.1 hypothetical protein tinsulaeT_18660 [Thalassotalea insulae]